MDAGERSGPARDKAIRRGAGSRIYNIPLPSGLRNLTRRDFFPFLHLISRMAERDEKLQPTASQEQEISVSPAYNDPEPRQPTRKIGEGRWFRPFFEPGSAVQIICAAALAIVIGMVVNVTVDEVPPAAIAILGIPGRLWLRALQAVGMSIFFQI